MRVLIAPDSFGDTLTAVEATAAIAAGWSAVRPDDQLIEAPQSDGGPGFVDVVAAAGGNVRTAVVEGPLGADVAARWLLDGADAYLESAQACGLGLLGGPPTPRTARESHSRGVGQLVVAALDAGARRIVVGLGGSSCTDGGRGLVEALAEGFGSADAAVARLRTVELVAATDVEHPLLGEHGAARVFGPQKGADPDTVAFLEDRNTAWAAQLRRVTAREVAAEPGAGAAGGIGAALLALGATRESGAHVVAQRTRQDRQLASAQLVVTGEGRLDQQSLRGKLVIALAAAARRRSIATLVLAGQVLLDTADLDRAGIDRALSLVDHAGSVELAMTDAYAQLRDLAAAAARGWEGAAVPTRPSPPRPRAGGRARRPGSNPNSRRRIPWMWIDLRTPQGMEPGNKSGAEYR
ncbi:glycerate kinase [Rhodococcus sp. 3A]|uniref:glycerate kinase family protein n=1 Tax=Rhodococcus sp. 3A TaxID=2834581 RepID=UPI002078D72D|nr:glycerate kinase [Rhodococcus sp. 3A]